MQMPTARAASDFGAGAFVGKPTSDPRQPIGRRRPHGFATHEGRAEVGRKGLGGKGGQDATKFGAQAFGGVEARAVRCSGLGDQDHHALNAEIGNGGGLWRGFDFNLVLHRQHARHLGDLAQHGVPSLPRAGGSSQRGDSVRDADLDPVEVDQVVLGQPTLDEGLGERVGFRVFRQAGRAGGEGRKQDQREQEGEQQAGDWEAEGRHDRVSPGKRPLGARGILCVGTSARHSQMGMDGRGGTQHGR